MEQAYTIRSLGGQYLRETMRECESRHVVSALYEAMHYLGYSDPQIVDIDGGDVYAYEDAAAASEDADGTGQGPVLVASPQIETDDDAR